MTILLAEDDADSRELVQYFLEEEGFRVVTAANGAAAVEMARDRAPDLILMDLRMPGVDGIEAIRAIRGTAALGDVPVIAMSADGLQGIGLFSKIDELGSGYIGYMPKPLNLESLLEQIDSLLRPRGAATGG